MNADELAAIQSATLHILEQIGVSFPSERPLRIFAEHGAQVELQVILDAAAQELGNLTACHKAGPFHEKD